MRGYLDEPSTIGAADDLAVRGRDAELGHSGCVALQVGTQLRLEGLPSATMAEIVDGGVASCPRCGTIAPYAIEKTGGGHLDSVVTCPRCGKFRVEGIDEHEDFSPGQ